MKFWLAVLASILCSYYETSLATFDMTLGHAQYLADHLTDQECKELMVILMRYPSIDDVPKISCLRNFLMWDRSSGRGQSSVVLRIPLKRIGREDLANDLDKMVEKEMAFRFENSPFHVRDSKRRDLSPGEKEMKMERTLNEMIDDYIKEFEEDDKGAIERLTGFKAWHIFLFTVTIFAFIALSYSAFFSRIRCVQNFSEWLTGNVPVYCCGILPNNIDKPHYDPEIHTLHSSYI